MCMQLALMWLFAIGLCASVVGLVVLDSHLSTTRKGGQRQPASNLSGLNLGMHCVHHRLMTFMGLLCGLLPARP